MRSSGVGRETPSASRSSSSGLHPSRQKKEKNLKLEVPGSHALKGVLPRLRVGGFHYAVDCFDVEGRRCSPAFLARRPLGRFRARAGG